MASPRVLLLDGHSLAYRAFYALPVENFSTTTGQPTNAVFGFTSMLINVLRDEQPTHVVVAFDVSRQTFRTEEFPDYKATRSKSPDEFKGQVELIKEILAALGIPVLAVDGYEADDIIATLTGRARSQDWDVAIVTGDRDAFQLVDDRVTVLYPKKGVSDLARMTPAAVEEKYGLSPAQYPDFAALRGDPSDNLPGIPGVGEKTATKWIREFGSLAGLVDHVDEVTGKVGDALRVALPQVLVNRRLTSLVADVPVDLDFGDAELTPWDRQAIDQLFDTLQFRALRERLEKVRPGGGDEPVPATESGQPLATRTLLAPEAGPWLAAVEGVAAVAAAGTWGRGTGEITALAIVDGRGEVGYLDLIDESVRELALDWLADPSAAKDLHDAKGPALALTASGRRLAGLRVDTALAAYLDAPGARGYGLSDVAQRVLGVSVDVEGASDQLMLDTGEEAAEALARQATVIRDLAEALSARLDAQHVRPLLDDLEIPLVPLLAEMEHDGIAVDLPGLRELSDEFGADMRRAEEEAHRLVGRPFNLGSPKQLQEILFGERNLPKTKRIKTGYTTDAEALQQLYAQTEDPLLEQLLAWRDRSKLRQTVDGLIPLADSSGRIHTTFNQMVAATGRLSSADPNLQNIPIRTDAGRRIRGCFVVGQGFETLLTADYSQIEMRIMAHLSEDTGLIDAFRSGEDLHTTVASRVFGVDPGAVDAEMRRRIKAMSYGLAYGLSAYGLSQQLDITPDEARRLMDDYFERFGGVRDYLAEVVERARAEGFTETMMGRRRYLPDLNSENRQRREMAERMALNAPIQGSAADIVKVSMLRLADGLREARMSSRLLLQVHDELVLEVSPGERDALEELVRSAMGGAADLAVPLDVSVGSGPSWEAAAH
ncbi:MAG: DNA polymerase I [Actinomycetales bacterium]|nr:DNA polymerase I [Actinomycetales bacterium]